MSTRTVEATNLAFEWRRRWEVGPSCGGSSWRGWLLKTGVLYGVLFTIAGACELSLDFVKIGENFCQNVSKINHRISKWVVVVFGGKMGIQLDFKAQKVAIVKVERHMKKCKWSSKQNCQESARAFYAPKLSFRHRSRSKRSLTKVSCTVVVAHVQV